MNRLFASLALVPALASCHEAAAPRPAATEPSPPVASASPPASAPPPAEAAAATPLTTKAVALPAGAGPISLDYIAYEPGRSRVWIPNAGVVGSVDVFDIAQGTFHRIAGWKTVEREANGRKRTFGPSAVTIGDGFAYIGNRATSEICAVDLGTLALGACVKLAPPTDGVVYVASAKEVWVTTPRDKSLAVLDARKPDALKSKQEIKLEGEPEGYAVDEGRGLFYTNLEDKNRTVVIDVKTHTVKATWTPGCGDDGPRGLALDAGKNLLFVACTDHVRVLDAGRDGAFVSRFDTGVGVDNIEWLEAQRFVYAAAGKAGRLTIARVDEKGAATIVASGPTAEGARNAVVDAAGNGYVVDAKGMRLLTIAAPKR